MAAARAKSRCRQLLTRCSLIGSPRVPQPEHTGAPGRRATVTIIPSLLNATSLTHARGSASVLLNAVVTRTSPVSFAVADLQTASRLPQNGGGGSPGTCATRQPGLHSPEPAAPQGFRGNARLTSPPNEPESRKSSLLERGRQREERDANQVRFHEAAPAAAASPVEPGRMGWCGGRVSDVKP